MRLVIGLSNLNGCIYYGKSLKGFQPFLAETTGQSLTPTISLRFLSNWIESNKKLFIFLYFLESTSIETKILLLSLSDGSGEME